MASQLYASIQSPRRSWSSTNPTIYVGEFNGDSTDDIPTISKAGEAIVKQSVTNGVDWNGWKNHPAGLVSTP